MFWKQTTPSSRSKLTHIQSGTSGKPKGVPHIVHHGYLYGVNGTEGLEVGGRHRWYQCMPLYHGTGGMASIICLMDGSPLCIGKKFSVSRFWDEVRASQATCFTYVGETVRYLLAAPVTFQDKEHGVTSIFGNGLRPDVWTKFRNRFGVTTVVEFFGSSEGVFALRNCSKGKAFSIFSLMFWCCHLNQGLDCGSSKTLV